MLIFEDSKNTYPVDKDDDYSDGEGCGDGFIDGAGMTCSYTHGADGFGNGFGCGDGFGHGAGCGYGLDGYGNGNGSGEGY